MSGFKDYFLKKFKTTEHDSFDDCEDTWNEQQKKIDAVLKLINEYKDLSNNKAAYNYIPEIEELLKCGKT